MAKTDTSFVARHNQREIARALGKLTAVEREYLPFAIRAGTNTMLSEARKGTSAALQAVSGAPGRAVNRRVRVYRGGQRNTRLRKNEAKLWVGLAVPIDRVSLTAAQQKRDRRRLIWLRDFDPERYAEANVRNAYKTRFIPIVREKLRARVERARLRKG